MDLRAAEQYALALKALDAKWKPHPKQIGPGRALFREGKKRLFLCFGRRTGKSTCMAYFAIRWALTNPGRAVAIVGPLLKQTRAIYWHSGLLKNLCPPDFVDSYHTTDGRITFKNGSTLTLYGADDSDALRGLGFSLLIIDEIKDVKPDFLDTIRPTLIEHKAPLIIAGTPPEVSEHPFWELEKTAQSSSEWAYFHATSYDNPYLDPVEIDKERAALEARGDLDVFMREYMAKFVPGGRRAVFSVLTDERHVRPYAMLWSHVHKKLGHWQLVCSMDPGTASVFAVLLGAVNTYTGQVRFLDEIYATQQAETSVGRIWPEVVRRMKEIYWPENAYDENQWYIVVDEAAAWARNELLDQFGVATTPTQKSLNKKADGVGLLKDVLRTDRLAISDRCVNLLREMKGYMLDKHGYFVKGNDHQIDNARYLLHASNYTFQHSEPPPDVVHEPDDRLHVITPADDWAEMFGTEHEPYLMDLD